MYCYTDTTAFTAIKLSTLNCEGTASDDMVNPVRFNTVCFYTLFLYLHAHDVALLYFCDRKQSDKRPPQ